MNTKEQLFQKTFDLLEQTGLNWTVTKEPLQTANGKPSQSFGIYKGDKWLGTVGPQYKPFQNFELAETIIEATEGIGLKATRGGSLSDESKVFLQAELPDEFIGKSGVKRWVTGLTSHDGSTSIGFGSANTVVVCQNTYYMAYKEVQKFRHTDTAKERVEKAMKELRRTMELDEKLMHNFKTMADIKLKDEIFAKVIEACFEADLNAKSEDVSTRKKNILSSVNDAIVTEIKLEGPTLWGLFNGITRYTNHVATKPEKKDEYVMSGTGYKTNLTAFNTIMEWIKANTKEEVLI